MVKLRLRRRGRKKHPFYDIVVIDGRARRDGAPIERLGYIDPMTAPKTVVLNVERSLYWLGTGAQPTEIVRQIFSREGVLLRRHLGFKGNSEEEIETAILQHREKASARHTRLKTRRVERVKTKAAAAAAAAAKAAEPAPAEPAPAEPAPVVTAPVATAPVVAAPVVAASAEPASAEPASAEPASAEPAPVVPAPVEVAPAPVEEAPAPEAAE